MGKKWEIYLNGILIYWLDCESGTEICVTPYFYCCEELVGQNGTNWQLLFSPSLAERVMEEEYQGDNILVSHNIMFTF